MPTPARTIYQDSFHFYKNERRNIVVLSAFLALILAVIHLFIGPTAQEYQLMVDFITNVKDTQLSSASSSELEALTSSVVGVAKKVFVLYAFETLLQSIFVLMLLMFTMAISMGHNVTLRQTLQASLPRLPKMFLLILLCSLLISAGYMVMIVPGIILLVGFALAPVGLVRQSSMAKAIRLSWRIGFSESSALIPALGIWILLQFAIGFLGNVATYLPELLHNFVFYLCKNLVSAWLIIYLFRLFTLVENKYTAPKH